MALSFSYFDPAAEAYKTITTPTKKIQVTGSDVVDAEPSAVAVAEVKKVEKKLEGIIGQHEALGLTGSLIPLVSRSLFRQILSAAIFLLVIGGLLGWLRKRRENPERRAFAAMEKAPLEALEASRKCDADRDVAGYFSAGRLAIQQRLGAEWNQSPQAITLAEINARISPESPVARFFREADLHEYNRQISGEIFPQWRALLDEAMFSLTSSDR